MQNKHRIYTLFLRLYPKNFIKQYGKEMTWVLDELLAENPSRLYKLSVWLRVGSELPLSIIQENINNLGGKNMNTVTHKNNRRTIVIILSILVSLIMLTAVIWLRYQILPYVTGLLYKTQLTTQLDTQNKQMADPFVQLGNTSTDTKFSCAVYSSWWYKTEVGCNAVKMKYIKIEDIGNKTSVKTKVDAIESKLKDLGFEGGGNGVTFTSLVMGTYDGIDYNPDAFYEKVSNDYHCTFDTNIAYANPSPPAINMTLSCTRTFNILGKPPTSIYQSTEGLNL